MADSLRARRHLVRHQSRGHRLLPVMSSHPFRFRRSLLAGVVGLLLAGNVTHAQTPPLAAVAFSNEVEASLVRALETLKVGGIKPALREIDLALERNPNFRLGHLIKGDLLMAKSGSPVAFGGSGQPARRLSERAMDSSGSQVMSMRSCISAPTPSPSTKKFTACRNDLV